MLHFAQLHNLYLIHDFAYGDICYDSYRAPSILSIDGAKERAVECYSLSKGFGLPGWRVGFFLGNSKLIGALKRIKGYVDFGIFQPLQIAAAALLSNPDGKTDEVLSEIVSTYETRRDVLCDGLMNIGWSVSKPKGSVFLWARIPEWLESKGSLDFARNLLKDAGVAVCPGVGFDSGADSYVRFAFVVEENQMRKAVKEIEHWAGNRA